MRKIITILLLVLSVNSFAQDSSKNKIIPPADSVGFISKVDLVEFNKYLKKAVSYEDYLKITPEQVVARLYNYALIEWNSKKKKVNK